MAGSGFRSDRLWERRAPVIRDDRGARNASFLMPNWAIGEVRPLGIGGVEA